jgi:hypothetical protein
MEYSNSLVLIFAVGVAFGAFMAGVIWYISRLMGPVPAEWGPPHGVSSSDSVVPPLHVAVPGRADIAPPPPVGSRPRVKSPDLELRIIKCSDPSMWYANKIGQSVPYLGVWPESGFHSLDDGGYHNVVKFEDGEVHQVIGL